LLHRVNGALDVAPRMSGKLSDADNVKVDVMHNFRTSGDRKTVRSRRDSLHCIRRN